MTDLISARAGTFNPPDESYNEAVAHLHHRLSELIFGSLVVAYVLGFVAFVAALPANSSKQLLETAQNGQLNDEQTKQAAEALSNSNPLTRSAGEFFNGLEAIGAQFTIYFAISITFAWLTLGLYRAYHFTILPRPTVSFNRIYYDFFLTLAQAMAFGLAMCLPQLFFPVLVFIFLIVIGRQYVEFNALAKSLQEHTTSPKYRPQTRDNPALLRALKSELALYLTEQPKPISLWRRSSRVLWGLVIGLSIASGVVLYFGEQGNYIMPWSYLGFSMLIIVGSLHTLSYGTLEPLTGPLELQEQVRTMCSKFQVSHKAV